MATSTEPAADALPADPSGADSARPHKPMPLWFELFRDSYVAMHHNLGVFLRLLWGPSVAAMFAALAIYAVGADGTFSRNPYWNNILQDTLVNMALIVLSAPLMARWLRFLVADDAAGHVIFNLVPDKRTVLFIILSLGGALLGTWAVANSYGVIARITGPFLGQGPLFVLLIPVGFGLFAVAVRLLMVLPLVADDKGPSLRQAWEVGRGYTTTLYPAVWVALLPGLLLDRTAEEYLGTYGDWFALPAFALSIIGLYVSAAAMVGVVGLLYRRVRDGAIA